MATLTNVTFTGVDDWTDPARLARIQKRFPLAEFGVLLSANAAVNGPRFPSPETISRLEGHGLNLSLHLCGRLAREALRGDYSGTLAILGERTCRLFGRIQLNVSDQPLPDDLEILNPLSVRETIIQQKDGSNLAGPLSWAEASVLIDPSGGCGKDTGLDIPRKPGKLGFAGGINPDNVYGKTRTLLLTRQINTFWIDMESGIRTGDRFDPDLVEAVIGKVDLALETTKRFRYTTEHINDTDVLVRVYRTGEKRIHYRFVVQDHGDWNAVEDAIRAVFKYL